MISLHHIRKRFGPVVALDGVTVDLAPGEIHALLGENGAGKSTLMKILYGMFKPDEGEIRVDDRPVVLRRPEDARRLGIGMVHQHFMLIERMTVAENVMLGDDAPGFWRFAADLRRIVGDSAAKLGMQIDPDATIDRLSVGERQRVEILRVLRRPVRVLILDEPTAVLTPAEVESLFDTLRRLQAEGCGIVFISHRLAEVVRLCDRVTVLRHGRTIVTQRIADTTVAELSEHMVGHSISRASNEIGGRRPMPHIAAPIVELQDVTTHADGRNARLNSVDLVVGAGEVVGVAGVEGNGQAALVQTVLGLRRPSAGVHRITAAGIAHMADDRQREALVLSLSVAENAVLKSHTRAPFSRHGVLNWCAVRGHGRDLIASYAIRTPSERTAVCELSGGNQQKLIAARELHGSPQLIIAVNPTRGLDLAATALLRRRLLDHRERGAAILLISSDLDELLELSDRIVVMFAGKVFATSFPRGGIQEIAALMGGVQP